MQITGANTTRLDLDIDIVVAERLGLEFIEVEFRPFLRVFNLEAFERVWINHYDLTIQKKVLINSIQSLKEGCRGRKDEKGEEV